MVESSYRSDLTEFRLDGISCSGVKEVLNVTSKYGLPELPRVPGSAQVPCRTFYQQSSRFEILLRDLPKISYHG